MRRVLWPSNFFISTNSAAGAADRTHERRIHRQYASSAENLTQINEVTREVVASRTFAIQLQVFAID